MPLFSDLSSHGMYYSGSNPSSATYNPYTTVTGASYSSSYLNSGGNYSNHSSLGGYTRPPPLASRWTSTGRTYSPLLSTISERGTSGPVRVNSPRRLPISSQYSPANYVPRPININTADIDVSRERYRSRPVATPYSYKNSSDVTIYSGHSPPKKEVPNKSSSSEDVPKASDGPSTLPTDDGPFMPRIDGKTGSGDDNSPGLQRSTIRRGRTVVRLHTLKRKERDSPRKAQEEIDDTTVTEDLTGEFPSSNKSSPKGSGWREKLSEDLIYKDKRERKTPGEKLIEKFILKDKSDDDGQVSRKSSPNSENLPLIDELRLPKDVEDIQIFQNKSPDRRCSMELLAEQANVLDTLIREENLSTTCLDLSQIGTKESSPPKEKSLFGSPKKRKSLKNSANRLQTTQSDYSLHERVKSLGKSKDKKPFPKKSSLKKSVSGGNICRLDSIVEFSKEPLQIKLVSIDENRVSLVVDNLPSKLKQKTKITSTVEVSQSQNPLKVRVGNVIVEQKLREPRKEINFSSVVENLKEHTKPNMDNDKVNQNKEENTSVSDTTKIDKNHSKKSKSIKKITPPLPDSDDAEGDDCNFWDKIGKRETIYLRKRREQLQDELIQSRRAVYWFPEEGDAESGMNEDIEQTSEPFIVIAAVDINTAGLLTSQVTPKICKNKDEVKTKMNINIKSFDVETKNSIISDVQTPNRANLEELSDAPKHDSNYSSVQVENLNVSDSFDQNAINDNEKQVKSSEEIIKQRKESPSKTFLNSSIMNNNINYDSRLPKCADQMIDTNIIETVISLSTSDNNKESLPNSSKQEIKITPTKLDLIGSDKQKSLSIKSTQVNVVSCLNKTDLENKTENITSKITNEYLSNHSEETHNESIKNINDSDSKNISNFQHETQITSNDNPALFDISKAKDIPEKSTVEVTPSTLVETSDVTSEKNETDSMSKEDSQKEQDSNSAKKVISLPSPMRKPVKDEPMIRPLIAKPRPLQKRVPQVINTSSSSETSSEGESDDEEADESSDSEGSTEFYECENTGQDGRTSTGSNDSGFDSSAPTSPAGFVCVKKDCDVNCHRKCEKLTANLCGVNQRLLVEALASRTASRRGGDSAGASTSALQCNPTAADSVEAGLEASTAYGVFRRTGRVTPPAKSIPRFRKYTIEDFHFLKVLGKGSFGKVLLAELRDTEYYYAVKCLKKDVVLEDDDVECTLIERKVLALGTNHPYLCHLFATFQTDSHLFFVMEYLNGGDLMFHIQQSGRFPEPRAKFYAAEIVSGLKFLHKRGIVYRDLKLDNILLDYEGHVRIADFGMCKLQIYLEKTADTFCGTPDYMAPEIIKGLKYNQTVDWWSFGVLLYEMLIGQSPFSGCDEDELFWSICNELPSYPRFLSQEAHTILVRLLDKDARTRLGGTDCMYGDVRDQDFFHSIHWERLDRRELESPFRPRVRHPYDTQYFDRAFTGERARLTAVEPNVLRTMDQQPFRGFSYTNPNATDR